MSNLIDNSIAEHINLTNEIKYLKDEILLASKKIFVLKETKNKLLICGNGGSASDSQHLASELIGRFEKNRHGFPAIALTNDSFSITAIGNDIGFKEIFSRQVEALGIKEDVLLAISTSGSSENILKAVTMAKSKGIFCTPKPGIDWTLDENCQWQPPIPYPSFHDQFLDLEDIYWDDELYQKDKTKGWVFTIFDAYRQKTFF